MSLLNSVVSALSATDSKSKEQGALLPALIQVISSYPGGLSGLIERFRTGGFGDVVSSWISQGSNQEIGQQDLLGVMGQPAIKQLVDLSGLNQQSVLDNLKIMLPSLINQASPNGQFDPSHIADASSLLGGLTQLFRKS
ncbi:YidB family protein [Alcaligenes pakistanensis]